MASASFRLFRPRHPLARLALALVGIVVIGAFLALSLFALAALLIGGAAFVLIGKLRRMFNPQAQPVEPVHRAASGIIEGDYTVVQMPSRGNR